MTISLKPYLMEALKELALLGSLTNPVEISSLELAEQLETSQQTASRYLLQLDKKDIINRKRGVKKQRVRITDEGSKILEEEYFDYKKIFELQEKLIFEGKVVSGFGEGKYYTEQEDYITQFREKIGFKPFPGTLNVKIKNVEKNKLRLLKNFDGIKIESFENDNRTFGSVICFKAEIENLKGAIVFPSRGHYVNILELISPYNLRKKIGLKDGERVMIKIFSKD